ncbi:MAG: glycosyltransferase family 4 protein [Paucibacter sp.]|nr:glycosyltransferase family 4 protein [Roseateles sp.]
MIHLDGIIFSLQSHGGISVYFRELLSRLATQQEPSLLTLERPQRAELDKLPAKMREQRPARALERYRACRPPSAVRASLFHSSYYRLPRQRGMPSVVTVHDFAYERCVGGLRTWVHATQKYAAIRQAQAIICISEATRDDLLEFVGVRSDQSLHVVYNGVSEGFQAVEVPAGAGAGAGAGFALFIGQRGRYKNFALALAALEHLPDLELHCVGGGPIQEHELAGAVESVRARVKHLGPVDDVELNRLYNTAQCLVYPSAYEGFGIPVLEAMRAGCPVVGIDCKAVKEVGGDALVVAEQARGDALAEAIRVTAGSSRNTLRERSMARASHFSWDRCFAQTLAVYRSLT